MKRAATSVGLTLAFLLLPLFAAAQTPVQVGEVIFVSGEALARHGEQQRTLTQGDPVHVGEELATAADGYVHVRFLDGGLISVRPNSLATIEAYLYDPADAARSGVRISLEQGVLRSATGKVGRDNKEGFRVNTPVAAIGIRGTDFVVYADSEVARLSVNAGGVVMAPFGADCLVEAFAPCSGDASAELFASVGKALLEVRAGQDYALITSDGPTPDEVNPPHPEETVVFATFVSRAQGAMLPRAGLSAPGAETYEEGLENAQRYIQQVSLVEEAYILGEMASNRPFSRDRGLVEKPAFGWGRWDDQAQVGRQSLGSQLSQLSHATGDAEKNISYGQVVTEMKLGAFALWDMNPGVERILPEDGRATFSLNKYDAYIMRGTDVAPEQAGISNPALVIDFTNAEFAASMKVHAASLPGVVTVLGHGSLAKDGSFSSNEGSQAAMDGMLSPDLSEAGLVFDYQISEGVKAVGATHWVSEP